MRFDLTSPCADCPFRKDVTAYLTSARVESIVAELEHKTFQCHKTVYQERLRDKRGRFAPRKPAQHCAGALIVMEKCDRRGDMQQIAQRLGLYDPERLRMESPVHESFDEMIEAARKAEA